MARALYRKYRSRSFDEIVGQSHVVDVLKNAIDSGKISHAYMLTGPRGSGKTSIARIIAHAVNKLDYSDEPHLDIIEIDAASNRRIDDIRDLRDKVHIAPTSTNYKVYIIDEVHMLTGESFNALLKTLEEPPEHAIFILATTELHKVPATILSRTQRFHFRPASVEVLRDHLKNIADKESIKIDDEALQLIAERGDGSFRDSISLLDQIAGIAGNITAEVVESMLGLAPRSLIVKLADHIAAKDSTKIINLLDDATKQGLSAVTITDQLIKKLAIDGRKSPQLFQLIDKLLDVKQSYDPLMKLLAVLVEWSKPAKTSAAHTSVSPTATFTADVKSKVTKSTPEPKPTPTPKPIKPTPEPIVETATPDTSVASAPIDGKLNWDKVMEALKNRYAPLFSVVSRAEMTHDENSITLTFNYALHRKKLENATYRGQLASVIEHTCGVKPEIIITGKTTGKVEPTPETQAVADIMGGGEVVRAV